MIVVSSGCSNWLLSYLASKLGRSNIPGLIYLDQALELPFFLCLLYKGAFAVQETFMT